MFLSTDEGRRKSAYLCSVLRPCPLMAPDFAGELVDQSELRPLLLLCQDVAFLGRGEAALGRKAELLQRRKLAGLVDAAPDIVFLLERAALRSDESEHHYLVAFRQEAQRLEAAGARAVIFQEIAIIVAAAEQVLRHGLIAARRNPGRPEIAAADMGGDRHVGGPCFQRRVDGARVSVLQMVDIEAAVLRLLELLLRAEIGPGGIVELQIPAA